MTYMSDCHIHLLPTRQVEKVEAEQALSEAIPALEEAAAALNDLKRDDITEIRSFAKPHILVQKVCVSGGCASWDGCKPCIQQLRV
jgi:hypothetical protein